MVDWTKAVKTAIMSIIFVCMVMMVPATAAAEGAGDAEPVGGAKENNPDTAGETPYSGETCWEKAERAYMFGVFSEDLPEIEGRFVSFDYESGAVYNYTLITDEESLIFNTIYIVDFEMESEPKMDGAVFRMNGAGCDLWIHNNPTGMLQITASKHDSPVIVKAELADGLVLSKLTNGTYEIGGLDEPAYLRFGGAVLEINENLFTVDISDYGHFMFSAIPDKGCGGSGYRYQYTMAVMNGSIDSELHVVTSNGESLTQKFEYQGKVEMRVRSLEQNRIRITVESEEHKGKVVAINLDKDTLNAMNCKEIAVKLDGDGLREASGVEEVVEAGGNEGVYYVEKSAEGLQALVYVPSFSEHEISIEKTGEPDDAVLFIGNIAVAVIAAVILGTLLYGIVRVKKQN